MRIVPWLVFLGLIAPSACSSSDLSEAEQERLPKSTAVDTGTVVCVSNNGYCSCSQGPSFSGAPFGYYTPFPPETTTSTDSCSHPQGSYPICCAQNGWPTAEGSVCWCQSSPELSCSTWSGSAMGEGDGPLPLSWYGEVPYCFQGGAPGPSVQLPACSPSCSTGSACDRYQDCSSGLCVNGVCVELVSSSSGGSSGTSSSSSGGTCVPPGTACTSQSDCTCTGYDRGVCFKGRCEGPG
jgi:hypothetical protein